LNIFGDIFGDISVAVAMGAAAINAASGDDSL
jgi:hypothetical protein